MRDNLTIVEGSTTTTTTNCPIYLSPAPLSLLSEVTSKTLRSRSPIYPIILAHVDSNLSSRYFCPTRRRPFFRKGRKSQPPRSGGRYVISGEVRVAGSSARPARWPRIMPFPPACQPSPCPLVHARHPDRLQKCVLRRGRP